MAATNKAIPLTYQGKTQNVAQWARELNISTTTIHRRLNQGLSMDEVFKKTSYRRI